MVGFPCTEKRPWTKEWNNATIHAYRYAEKRGETMSSRNGCLFLSFLQIKKGRREEEGEEEVGY